MNSTLNDFSATDINGVTTQLSSFKGKVVVVVNVASFCGYTKQYATLETLYRTYSSKGLVVLGFPSNDFGEQEPGTDAEINEFCTTNFNISFPLFSKVHIKGANKAPLYAWLTSGGGKKALEGEIRWNFEKFIISRDGIVKARYKWTEDPMSESFVRDIEAALAE